MNKEQQKQMLINRINRFYSEGSCGWSKNDIAKHGVDFADLCEWSKDWVENGCIEIIGKEECYFKVLKEID